MVHWLIPGCLKAEVYAERDEDGKDLGLTPCAASGEYDTSYPLRFPFPISELLAEGDFLEFADGSSGNGVEEHEGIRELPLGERFGEESAQFFRRSLRAVFQHDGRKRAFLPLRMRDANHAGLFHRGMTHQRVFQIDGADPFAA